MHPGPPLSSPFSPPCVNEPHTPPFSLAAPRTRAPSKAADRAPLSIRFSSPSAPCATASQLPTKPVCAIPRLPQHQKSEPPPASSLRLLGKPVLRASWLTSGVCITLSHWHCRTPPPAPPMSHHRRHLVMRVAPAPAVLTPPFLGHLVRQSMRTSHAAPLLCAWPLDGAHAASASSARALLLCRGPPPRLDRTARLWPSRLVGRPHVAGRHTSHCSLRPDSALRVSFKIFSNCFK
jgi:hypothetical protein